uniref:Branched-chain-amino-acid aminotransferase n=1 Tax=Ganoderma boninense TaxID=34458 RepID=A0A5K1K430_9APHY|nr:Zn(2)-C6 fungal-type domain-containing protein [Ganoderma boninense]
MASSLRSVRLTLSQYKSPRVTSHASNLLTSTTPRLSPSRQLPFNRALATLHGGQIQASLVEVTPSKDPRTPPPPSTLVFGHTFTDHMLAIPWHVEGGWGTPKIQPYAPLPLSPSATVFHYAHCLFEGLKAYRDPSGKVTLFRPDMNMKRMNTSAERVAMPTFNGDAVIELMKQLIRLDKHWIPEQPGYSLYIRPTMIGTQPALGIAPPKEALLFVICSPVGPYYPQGFKPVALYGTTEYTRASHGGIGAYKLGANYAAGVAAQKAAAQQGYVQNLWLHGPEHHITEVGTMNAFVAFKRDNGVTELVTPPLDGIILPGVTRDSVLALARDHAAGVLKIPELTDKLVVSERPVTMKEVKAAAQSGELVEFFGVGTAAVVSPVDRIGYLGEDLLIPTGPDGMGPLSRPLWKYLTGIQTGAIVHPWSIEV